MRFLCSLLLLSAIAVAQNAEQPRQTPRRLKIGVALSGGSALGLAHIGVLKWFEEHRIPIDYIAGASMGSLVGGLYATGHSPAELREFVSKIDWNFVLSPTVPFPQQAFRRKEDAREYPSTIELGYKRKGIRLPSGLNAGHGVGLVLSRFTAPYGALASFDDLATPFRCVATDLNTGAQVVFDKGPLFDALRSSMSIPGIFAPVQLGNKLLVDGALLNNIPVDQVKKMGADIVIAVAFELPPADGKNASLLTIAARSVSVMITANERHSIGMADLVIMPELKGLGGSDYSRYDDFSQRGYDSAARKTTMMERFALSPADYQAYLDQRRARRRVQAIKPDLIEVDGDIAPRRKAALIAAIAPPSGQPIDPARLEAELTKVTGMGRFDSVNYSSVRRDGKDTLVIKANEKDYGPPFFRLSMLLDASRQEGLRFGIGGRFTFLDLGGPASEWRTDLSIGQINRLSSEYYYRLKGGKWFVAPHLYFLEDTLPLYVNGERISDFTTRQTGGNVDLGYAFGRFREFRAGYAISHNRIAVTKGQDAFDPLTGRYSDVHVRWSYEGQDSALVPRRGIRLTTSGALVVDHPGVSKKFVSAESTFSYARPFNTRYSLLTNFSGGFSPNETALSSQFWIGGVGRMDAIGRGQLIGHGYYLSSARLLRSLNSDSLAIFGRFYLFTGAEAGKAWYEGISPKPRYSGSLGLMGETAVGLVYFGAGIGDQGDRRLFFRLGRVF
jgi:NTE family protein